MSGLIDWGLAGRVAAAVAGDGPARMGGDVDLAGAGARGRDAVLAYTGLEPAEPLPEPEWVSRREWAQINLASMSTAIAPLEQRLADQLPLGPARNVLTPLTATIAGAQAGALVGYASRRVLGQYEFPLLGGAGSPRLLFVGENLGEAAAAVDGEPQALLDWVALHEVTHAVHFASAPWLREHVGGLARSLLLDSRLAIEPGRLLSAARGLVTSDPRRLLAGLAETDPLTLLAAPASRELIERIQTAMASVEGYAEHVMDAAAGELGDAVRPLRAATERRRAERGPLARLLSWLLGMELKLRQYRDGKRFADAVVAEAGIDGLNQAWRGPESLPSAAELADPSAWVARCATPAARS